MTDSRPNVDERWSDSRAEPAERANRLQGIGLDVEVVEA